jgi:hypothetical protein
VRMKFIVMLGLFALIGSFMFSPIQAAKATKASEAAKYSVVSQQGNIEHRQYQNNMVAEVTVEGGRKTAMRQGFKLLAGYINGENNQSKKIEMTVPVVQQYLGKPNGQDAWKIKFFMPPSYTAETLPMPNNDSVRITNEENVKLVALRFNGAFETDNITKHRTALETYLKDNKIASKSEEMYAAYNPPWTPNFLRRNEVMFQVD